MAAMMRAISSLFGWLYGDVGFWIAVYMFDKVFASFSLLTRKNSHKKKMHIN